jgi:hypothetical protein
MLDKRLLQYLEIEDHILPEDVNLQFPEWLSPLWCLFLREKDPGILKLLRQVLVFGYKASFEPSDEQLNVASAAFDNTDANVGNFEDHLDLHSSLFWRTARSIVARVTGAIDWTKIVPFHGPGAVFPHCDPKDRSNFTTINSSINPYYDYWSYFFCIPGFIPSVQELSSFKLNEDSSPIKGKLVFVPKDSRGPRTICVHPKESIWIQQGQRVVLERAIEKTLNHHINFGDQSINGNLARTSSLTREFCTLDLKDASDRLGCKVVEFLFGSHYQWLSCTRLREVELPCGRVIALKKWAPMGNALCFPVESLVFYALVRASIQLKFGTKASLDVYVFGDDIIVPSKCYDAAIQGLVRAGLSVNTNKSFVLGFFRESCGVEAYKGFDVTPLRMKTHKIRSSLDCVSICEFAKNLLKGGYRYVSGFLYSEVRRYLRSVGRLLPITNNVKTGGLVEYAPLTLEKLIRWNEKSSIRWNNSLHRYELRTFLVHARTACCTGDWYHLQDALISLEKRDASTAPSGSSSRYPVPHRESLKCGWTVIGFDPITS